jgi:hypothetical protein
MPATKETRRPKVSPVVVAVVQPVTRRLSRIEDLLIEMRGVQDTHLKHIAALQKQLDELSEKVEKAI